MGTHDENFPEGPPRACGVFGEYDGPQDEPCLLPAGHAGQHVSKSGFRWSIGVKPRPSDKARMAKATLETPRRRLTDVADLAAALYVEDRNRDVPPAVYESGREALDKIADRVNRAQTGYCVEEAGRVYTQAEMDVLCSQIHGGTGATISPSDEPPVLPQVPALVAWQAAKVSDLQDAVQVLEKRLGWVLRHVPKSVENEAAALNELEPAATCGLAGELQTIARRMESVGRSLASLLARLEL